METFYFLESRKVTVWIERSVKVKGETKEEALGLLLNNDPDAVRTLNEEVLFNTEEKPKCEGVVYEVEHDDELVFQKEIEYKDNEVVTCNEFGISLKTK